MDGSGTGIVSEYGWSNPVAKSETKPFELIFDIVPLSVLAT